MTTLNWYTCLHIGSWAISGGLWFIRITLCALPEVLQPTETTDIAVNLQFARHLSVSGSVTYKQLDVGCGPTSGMADCVVNVRGTCMCL